MEALTAKRRRRVRRAPKGPWLFGFAALFLIVIGAIFWGGLHGDHAIAQNSTPMSTGSRSQ